jgi:hypothetical protein
MHQSSPPARRRLQSFLDVALLAGAVLATLTAVAVVSSLFWWISLLPSVPSAKPLAESAEPKPPRPLSAAAPRVTPPVPAAGDAAPPSSAAAPSAAEAVPPPAPPPTSRFGPGHKQPHPGARPPGQPPAGGVPPQDNPQE